MRTALVLSGGGAKGSAHIGVLKAIEELEIEIDLVIGVSIGAVIGAGYAILKDSRKLEEYAYEVYKRSRKLKLNMERMISGNLSRLAVKIGCWYMNTVRSALPAGVYFKAFRKAFGDLTFKDTVLEFHAIATDLKTGETIILSEGKLMKALEASMAIPGIFPPVEMDGKILVDGGTTNNLPVDIAKSLGADFVIAVDLSSRKIPHPKPTANSYLVFLDRVRDRMMTDRLASMADVYIHPPVDGIDTLDFSRTLELVDVGYKTALEEIQKFKSRNL